MAQPVLNKKSKANPYRLFDKIDGTHPWTAVDNGHVPYAVRNLPDGKVMYFNFLLAKEMGLIPKDHPHKINPQLTKKILSTFNIRIINEFDIENDKFNKAATKPNKFMASRYLQLQHKDKRGLSSGDGRGIWNGSLKHRGTTWDISSRGTGVTCLAPGSSNSGKNLETGSEEFGYGCGLAEIDELIGSAIMSETIHNYGLETERMLIIIDSGDGCGIGVRAGKNLIRPAHLFLHLKQNNHHSLKQAVDYFIDRQVKNKDWLIPEKTNKYTFMLKMVTSSFAKFSAQLEREYLFTWLDWDGDNVLANAGLIDYGSIRWLGLRHDKYRYDDVQRFSTTLNEQRKKAELTVQVFIQLIDFLKTKNKKPIAEFKNNKTIKEFNTQFDLHLKQHFLFQVGFNKNKTEQIYKENKKLVDEILFDFTFFEKLKTKNGEIEVEDGINHPPILNMRYFLLHLPKMLIYNNFNSDSPQFDGFIFEVASEFATEIDIQNLEKYEKRFQGLINKFQQLLQKEDNTKLNQLLYRNQSINREERMTGNALIFIVQKIMSVRETVTSFSMQKIIDALITKQMLNLDDKQLSSRRLNTQEKRILNNFDNLIDIYKEDL